ncbi:MAG: hypothetical protein V1779_13580, partial [bacterium]
MINFKKNIIVFIIISIIMTIHVFAQKESYNWYFGTKLGLSFNTQDTLPQRINFSKLWGPDACSTISDSNGKLLMYTNGDYLFNFLHDTLAILNDTLKKDSTKIRTTQNIANGSTLIIPKPETDSLYYVIHTIGKNLDKMVLYYQTFDMKNNKGKGELWDSKKLLHRHAHPYMLAATRHGNRKDFWLATLDEATRGIFFYHARNRGIYISHQLHTYANYFKGNYYNLKMKFSPNGDKLGLTYLYTFDALKGDKSPIILILDFDNYTGLLKNPIMLRPVVVGIEIDSLRTSGIEFSTDSKRVYAFGRQYKLDAGTELDIQNSEFRFYDMNKTFGDIENADQSILNDYQLGPDGRIYFPWKDTVDIMFEPGAPGDSCNFVLSHPGFVATIGPPWVDHSEALPSFPSDFFRYEILIQNNFNKKKWLKSDIEICESSDLLLQTNELLRSRYLWTGPSGYTSNKKDPLIKNLTPSMTGWYKVTATRNYGEVSKDSIFVNVKPMPPTRLFPKGNFEKCKYTPLTLKAEPDVTGNRYFWSTGESSTTISIDSAGKYYLTIIDSAGCSRKDSVEINIRQLYPEVEIIGEPLSCEGDTVILRTKESYSRYIWTTGDSTREIIITKSTRCTVEAIDSNGCAGYSDEMYILFYFQPKTVLKGSKSVCIGSSHKYCILKTNKDSVIWEVSGGKHISSIGTDTIIIEWDKPGIGKVVVKQISNKGCIGKDSFLIDIDDEVKPEIIPKKTVICGNGTVTLKTSEQYVSYEWSTGETSDTIVVSSAGLYSVKVTAEGGCTGYDTIMVINAEEPIPVIIGETTICRGESTILSVNNDFAEYIWNTGETTKDITVNQTGNYTVEVTDSNGC